MNRPKLLDLFSGEGGAAVGYDRAGFDVYGVDVDPKVARRYPYPIHIGDALDVLARLISGESIDFHHPDGRVEWLILSDFVGAHGSPPCQFYSKTANAYDSEGKHPDLVEPTRALLIATGLPYVIENVEGAPLIDPLTLCGTEFALRAPDVDGVELALLRHRLFESNLWLMGAGGCSHDSAVVAGVYSGSRHNWPEDRDNPARRGGYVPRGKGVTAALLGIDWMTQKGREQSIPPAYTEFIGSQLIAHLEAVTG